MEIRESANSKDFERYNTEEIRREFLIDTLFETGVIHRVYSNVDRVITMGAMPTVEPLNLEDQLNIWSGWFSQRQIPHHGRYGHSGSRHRLRAHFPCRQF